MTNNKISLKDPVLDFEPLYYILDKCALTVLAAKKQDKYEVSGVYIRLQNDKWVIWPANLNNQNPWEYPTRYVITKDKDEAWMFALDMSEEDPMPEEWCQFNFTRSEDFPKY